MNVENCKGCFRYDLSFVALIASFSNFCYWAYAIFEHIFEHINGPLSGVFWRTEKCRTKEIRGGAFSIRLVQLCEYQPCISSWDWNRIPINCKPHKNHRVENHQHKNKFRLQSSELKKFINIPHLFSTSTNELWNDLNICYSFNSGLFLDDCDGFCSYPVINKHGTILYLVKCIWSYGLYLGEQ